MNDHDNDHREYVEPRKWAPAADFGEIQLKLNDDVTNGEGTYEADIRAKNDTLFPTIVLDVEKIDRTELSQQHLASFFGNWKVGEFRRSFTDLQQATKDSKSLELGEIEKILDPQAARGEVLEILTLKIPIDQVAIWGTVVILGVQVYFVLFLRQLSGKLSHDDAAWDVPWIGMDQTKFAQYVLFLTIVVLPCGAIGALGVRTISLIVADYRSQPEQLWLVVAKIATIVGSFALAVTLAVLSWKHRPLLKQEVQ